MRPLMLGFLATAALLSGCVQEGLEYPPTSPSEQDYFRQDNYYSDEERVEVLRSYEEHAQVKGGRFALANRNQHAALCDELRTAEGRERSVARDIYERYEPYLAQVNMAVILPPECTTGQCGEWFGEKYFCKYPVK